MKVSKGTVFKRGNVYWYRLHIDGKRIQKTLDTSSRPEAYQRFSKIKEKLELGITPTALSSVSFSHLKKKYLSYAESTKAKSSVVRDTSILKKMEEFFRNKSVPQINREMIEEYIQKQQTKKKKIHAPTVNREVALMKHVFKKAEDWGFVKENPVRGMQMLKVQKKSIRYLSDNEIDEILKKAQGIWRAIVIMFLETGLRAGELSRLAWKDIDVEKRILAVHQTKSYKPRYIEISDRLLKVLESLPKDEAKVFPFGTDYVIHRVSKICEDAGMEDVTCHVLRHTFASRLVMAGVNLRTVQALMGHSNITTTMVYSHLAPGYMTGIGEKLGYRYGK